MSTIRDLDEFRALDPFFRTIEQGAAGKIVRWRDYLDPVVVFDAIGWPQHAPDGH